jgi:CRISPR system Cascade subunit CasE
MFISRIEVDWAKARNPYDLHRAVWTLFPDQEREARKTRDQVRNGFLFRVEENAPGRPARLLVQSRITPKSHGNYARVLGQREFNPLPRVGQYLAFLLTANPVKTVKDEKGRLNSKGKTKACRVPLLREEEQRAWLERQLGEAARVCQLEIQPHPPSFFHGKGHDGKLLTVTYYGQLEVTETGTLLKHLENGIGPAKAFGCGLLLVRRI